MRFRRRDAPDESLDAAAGPAPVPVAVAGVLDGRRLWLTVAAQPGRPTLRAADGGLLDVPDELADDAGDPRWLAARLDLAGLPAGAAAYDVVLALPDGSTRPLTAPPDLPVPARTASAPGGSVRHRLERADGGALRLRTEVLAPAATLVALTAAPDGVRLTTDAPAAPVHLLDDAGELLASWPAGVLDAGTLGGGAVGPARVVVGDGRLPVRRRDDDLADPGRGAPLPGVGRLRLRWSDDGLLQARVVAATGTGEAGA